MLLQVVKPGSDLNQTLHQDSFDARELVPRLLPPLVRLEVLATIERRPAPLQTDDFIWSHKRTTIGQRYNSRFSPSFERG